MEKRDISAPSALPHNRLEWSSARRQRPDDNTKRKEQTMNEENNFPEEQKLSWILEEYRAWAEKHKYEFITIHNGRMGANNWLSAHANNAKIKIEIHEGKAHARFETDAESITRHRSIKALDDVPVSVETLLVFCIREVISDLSRNVSYRFFLTLLCNAVDVDDSILDKDDTLWGGMENDPFWDNMKNDRLWDDEDEDLWDDEDDCLWDDEDDYDWEERNDDDEQED